jgi:soluble lytic murein transglycosylase-like protein
MFTRENDFDDVLYPIAAAHGVDPALVKAIIGAESEFNPDAQGDAGLGGGSMGLMQVNLATAQGMGFTGTASDLLDPNLNIEFGTRILEGALQQANGDPAAAASIYNGGYRPKIGFGQPVPADTVVQLHAGGTRTVPAGQFFNQAYVDRVMALYAYFQGQAPPTIDAGGSSSADTGGGGSVAPSIDLTAVMVLAALAALMWYRASHAG